MSNQAQAIALINKPLNELTDIDLILTLFSTSDLKDEYPDLHASLESLLRFLLDIDSIYQLLLKAHKKPPMDYFETNKDLGNFLQKAVELSNNVPMETRGFLEKQLDGLESLKKPRESIGLLKDGRIKGFYEYFQEYLWKLKAEEVLRGFGEEGEHAVIDLKGLEEQAEKIIELAEKQGVVNKELVRDLMLIIEKSRFLARTKEALEECQEVEELEKMEQKGRDLGFEEQSQVIKRLSNRRNFILLMRNYSRENILNSLSSRTSSLNEESIEFCLILKESQTKKPNYTEVVRFLDKQPAAADSEALQRDLKDLSDLEHAFSSLKTEFPLEKELFIAETRLETCRARGSTLFFGVVQGCPIHREDLLKQVIEWVIEFKSKELLFSERKRDIKYLDSWLSTLRNLESQLTDLADQEFYQMLARQLDVGRGLLREFESVTQGGERKKGVEEVRNLLNELQKQMIDFSNEGGVLEKFLQKASELQNEVAERFANSFKEKIKLTDAKLLYSKVLAFPLAFPKETDLLEKELGFLNEIKPIVREFEIKPWNLSSLLAKYREHAIEVPEIEALIAKNAEISNRGLKVEAKIQELEGNIETAKYEDFMKVVDEFEALNLNKNPEISAFRKSLKRRLFLLKTSFIHKAIASHSSTHLLRISYKSLQKDLEIGYSLIKREKNIEELAKAIKVIEESLEMAEAVFQKAEESTENLDKFLLVRNFLDLSEEILQYKAAYSYDPQNAKVLYKSNNLNLANHILIESELEGIVKKLELRKKNAMEENQEILRERGKSVRILGQVLVKFQLNETTCNFFAKKIEEVLFSSTPKTGPYQIKMKKICEILIFMASGLKKVAKELKRRGFDKETLLKLVELDDLKRIPDIVIGRHLKPGKKRGRKPKHVKEMEAVAAAAAAANAVSQNSKPIQKYPGKRRGRKPKNRPIENEDGEVKVNYNAEENKKNMMVANENEENTFGLEERNNNKYTEGNSYNNDEINTEENMRNEINRNFERNIEITNNNEKFNNSEKYNNSQKFNNNEKFINNEKFMNFEKYNNSEIYKNSEKVNNNERKFEKNSEKNNNNQKIINNNFNNNDDIQINLGESMSNDFEMKNSTTIKKKAENIEKKKIVEEAPSNLKRLKRFREDFEKEESKPLVVNTVKKTIATHPISQTKKQLLRNPIIRSAEKDLKSLFSEKPKPREETQKHPETLLGRVSAKQKEEPSITKKQLRKGKEVIQIISSGSEDENKQDIKPILFDPDSPKKEKNIGLNIAKNNKQENKIVNNTKQDKAKNEAKPIQKVEKKPESASEKDPLYSLFQGRFKFNKSHSKTFIELFTTAAPSFHIPPFPAKNPEKPKLVTSGTTGIQTFIRFYFENQSSNPRDMLMGWLESLDEASDQNLESLAEELRSRQEITGLKFGLKNSASIHFLSMTQLDEYDHLSAIKKKLIVWTKPNTTIRMIFLITVNSDLVDRSEGKLDFLKVLKGDDWALKRLSEVEKLVPRERVRRELEQMLDEEREELEEDEEADERIMKLFGKKKRKI